MSENDNDNVFDHENDIEQLFDDSDPNTWTATEELATLPTAIFKKNTLSQATRKTILQSKPRNKDISFKPPIMDCKIWSAMSQNARENDKNLRRIVYRFSSVVKPINNTLRLVYASKSEDQNGETYKAWSLLEQTVLNNRVLALDALSFVNELWQEQALKATIFPSYHKSPDKEEVFGDELHNTIKEENETNKLLNDAAYQWKRASQQSYYKNNKYSNNNVNFRNPNKFNSKSKNNHKNGGYSSYKKYQGNEQTAG
jgi:hypothetical protein